MCQPILTISDAVHDLWNDIAFVARCNVDVDGNEKASFMVTNGIASMYQMTGGEVMEEAYKNTSQQGYVMRNINDTMRDMMESEGMPQELIDEIISQEVPLYVLTNKESVNGANVISCPEVLEKVYEEFGEGYYVLPSSIHEVLLVKESESPGVQELRQTVFNVNKQEVAPQEVLSYNVFHYDGRKLSMAMEDVQEVSKTAEKVKERTSLFVRL